MIKEIKGNLITLAQQDNFAVIVHGCNCFNTMGAGIAKAIKESFPQAYQADLMTQKGDEKKLGTISTAKSGDLIIVNAYTQFHYGTQNGRSPVDYTAIRRSLTLVKEQFEGLPIGIPKIGAGLAGGDWDRILNSLYEIFDDYDDLTIVTLD